MERAIVPLFANRNGQNRTNSTASTANKTISRNSMRQPDRDMGNRTDGCVGDAVLLQQNPRTNRYGIYSTEKETSAVFTLVSSHNRIDVLLERIRNHERFGTLFRRHELLGPFAHVWLLLSANTKDGTQNVSDIHDNSIANNSNGGGHGNMRIHLVLQMATNTVL